VTLKACSAASAVLYLTETAGCGADALQGQTWLHRFGAPRSQLDVICPFRSRINPHRHRRLTPLSFGFNTECRAAHRVGCRVEVAPLGRGCHAVWDANHVATCPKGRGCHAVRVATCPNGRGCHADRAATLPQRGNLNAATNSVRDTTFCIKSGREGCICRLGPP
jgi:hypothetical protein